MTAHAPIAPSALHRLKQCPASLRMQAAYPEAPDSDRAKAAADGTAAHDAMRWLFEGYQLQPGIQASNGVPLTLEMIQAAQLIVNDVRETAAAYGMPASAAICEQPVAVRRIHPDCWGTPDLRLWVPHLNLLIVWDLKFGFRYVDEFENPQLIAYGVGDLETRGVHDLTAHLDLRIVQPRAYSSAPIRSWKTPAAGVRAEVNLLAAAATEALKPDSKARTGTECLDCSARGSCPTFQRAAQAAMEYSGTPMPHDLPDAALGLEAQMARQALKILEARYEALEEQLAARIRGGARIPGVSIKAGQRRTIWTKSDEQVIAVGQLIGKNLAKPAEAITPKQALDAGVLAEVVQAMSESVPGKSSITFDTVGEYRRIFSN